MSHPALDELKAELKEKDPSSWYRSPEWLQGIGKHRMKLAEVDEGAKGGRPSKPTQEESYEHSLEKMWPAAMKILKDQVEAEDPRVARAAAVEIMRMRREYTKGMEGDSGNGSGGVTIIFESPLAVDLFPEIDE